MGHDNNNNKKIKTSGSYMNKSETPYGMVNNSNIYQI